MELLDNSQTQSAQSARTESVPPGAEVGTPTKLKSGRKLWTHSGILGRSLVVRMPIVGVYFLIDMGEVVYVGKSINVHDRIRTHMRGEVGASPARPRRMQFTHFTIHNCSRHDLNELERAYIDALMPRYNQDLTTRARRALATSAPRPLSPGRD
jgi:hypothetical protein